MKLSQSDPVDLAVSGPDEVSEIFLVDANFERIATGVGHLKTSVAPGLYKIRCRSGSTQNDSLIEVPEGASTHAVTISPVEFRSAAPIAHTSTLLAYQATPAEEGALKVHQRIGNGAQIYLFVRESSETRSWEGCDIALYDLKGARLIGIEAGFADESARVAGVNTELDPGTYALRVSNADLGSYETYLTASPGWQTQLFLSFDDFWIRGESVRVPSIRKASLFMAKMGRGFNSGGGSVRASELARQALAQSRDVISKGLMERLLSGKFEDPILGIIVAHILLERRRHDTNLLETVCGNLCALLGEHPDVQALQFTLGIEAGAFVVPPTFRHSWDRIVKATRRRASLVTQQGVVAQIAADVVRTGPWLTRRVPEVEHAQLPSSTIADASRLVQRFLESDSKKLVELAGAARARRLPLSGVEHVVLDMVLSRAKMQDRDEFGQQEIPNQLSLKPKDMLLKVDAPSYVVANAVSSLASKLKIGL